MKNTFYILLAVLIFLVFSSSCGSSADKPEYTELGSNLDFGKGTYRPNPFKFLDNIPPFSWMGMPDSVKKTTELAISFNEDAVRSKSTAQLAFVDINGNKIEGIKVGKSDGSTFPLKANTTQAFVPVTFTVNPNIGDSILNGSIVILGNDLDKVNGTSLGTTLTPVATWSLEHKIGINWWRWTILILIVAAILGLIVLIIYLLYHGVIWCASGFSSLTIPLFSRLLTISKSSNGKNRKKKQYKKVNKNDKQEDDGRYAKEIKHHKFKINRNYIIPNGSQHKNPYGKTCGQILDELNDKDGIIKVKKGEPIFNKDGGTLNGKPLKAKFPEGIDKYLKPDELKRGTNINRNKLHDEAFRRIAKAYKMDMDQLQVFKGNSEPVERLMQKWNCSEQEVFNRCNNPHRIARVLHECRDGKTIQLVPWVYHHIPHTGGIEAVASKY